MSEADKGTMKLAPSILAADCARLGQQVVEAEQAMSPAVLEEIVHDLDQVLVMTVNPGFGHQQFLRTTLPKIGSRRLTTSGSPPIIMQYPRSNPQTPPLVPTST